MHHLSRNGRSLATTVVGAGLRAPTAAPTAEPRDGDRRPAAWGEPARIFSQWIGWCDEGAYRFAAQAHGAAR